MVVAGAVWTLSSERKHGWSTYRQLMSHVTSCEGHIDDSLQRTTCVRSSRALFILGQFCDQFGQYDQAIRWFQKGLSTGTHLSTLSNLEGRDGVSTVMLNKGQLHEALTEFQTLYAEATARLGIRHELTNRIANSLGITYKKIDS